MKPTRVEDVCAAHSTLLNRSMLNDPFLKVIPIVHCFRKVMLNEMLKQMLKPFATPCFNIVQQSRSDVEANVEAVCAGLKTFVVNLRP